MELIVHVHPYELRFVLRLFASDNYCYKHMVSSYTSISFLPIISKNLLIARFTITNKFSPGSSVWVSQTVLDYTKQYCSAAFVDISQAFKFWHSRLLYKIRNYLSAHKMLESHLLDRFFIVKLNQETSNQFPIKA